MTSGRTAKLVQILLLLHAGGLICVVAGPILMRTPDTSSQREKGLARGRRETPI